jgi:hypothetical protein
MEQTREKREPSKPRPLAFCPGLTISIPTDTPICLEGYPKVAFVYSLSENKRYKNLLAEKGAEQYKVIK